MKVFFKTQTGATHVLTVQSSDTVEDVKCMYEASHLSCVA